MHGLALVNASVDTDKHRSSLISTCLIPFTSHEIKAGSPERAHIKGMTVRWPSAHTPNRTRTERTGDSSAEHLADSVLDVPARAPAHRVYQHSRKGANALAQL